MKKLLTVVVLFTILSLCVSSAFADVEWMDTITSSGIKYEGYVENGDLNGFGIATYSNGSQSVLWDACQWLP